MTVFRLFVLIWAAAFCWIEPLLAQSQNLSYKHLDDVPPNLGERLPCPPEMGNECSTRVRLKRDLTIWGVPLKGHTIASDWEEDRNGILARDFLYKGVWLKGGKKIWFYVTWGGTLLKDQVFDGVPCKADSKVSFEDRRLTECTLGATHKVQGIDFAPGTKLTFLGLNNTLSWADLRVPHHIGGHDYPAGVSLRFDENGVVIDQIRR